MSVATPGDGGRQAHGRAPRTRAFAAGASAVTFLVTVGVLAVHDNSKSATGTSTDVNATATTPTTTVSPASPFDDDGGATTNPFSGGRASPSRTRSGSGGFTQPDTSSRGS